MKHYLYILFFLLLINCSENISVHKNILGTWYYFEPEDNLYHELHFFQQNRLVVFYDDVTKYGSYELINDSIVFFSDESRVSFYLRLYEDSIRIKNKAENKIFKHSRVQASFKDCIARDAKEMGEMHQKRLLRRMHNREKELNISFGTKTGKGHNK